MGVLLCHFLFWHGHDLLALSLIRGGIALGGRCFVRHQEFSHITGFNRGGVALVAHEGGHTRGFTDDGPSGVIEFGADEDVARQQLALHNLLLAVLVLEHLLNRNDNLKDRVLDLEGLGTHVQVGLYLVFVAGIALNDVPLARLLLQLAGKRTQALAVGGVFGLILASLWSCGLCRALGVRPLGVGRCRFRCLGCLRRLTCSVDGLCCFFCCGRAWGSVLLLCFFNGASVLCRLLLHVGLHSLL